MIDVADLETAVERAALLATRFTLEARPAPEVDP